MIKLINARFEELNEFKPRSFDLAFLDPPDNINMGYDNYCDNLPFAEYINLLHRWIIKACELTIGPVFVSFNEKWTGEVEDVIRNNNLLLVQRLYWHFTFGQCGKQKYTPSSRPIYWLNNSTIYPENIKIPSARQLQYNDKRAKSGGKIPDNVWDYSRICGTFKEKRKFHPTQHPEALMERIILGHSKVGDLILDPFVGSGTTAIVCKRHNRNCVGIDISEYYLNQIKNELDRQFNGN